ncbi:MAG: carboxylating nicotinate-nucleotide diphosphorylase [Elusimicrobia bacterium]|nr:carboxylating nicotinate-nucleotide diphosphorylase [Elusimicrobiota bacterium]
MKTPTGLKAVVRDLVRRALAEDLGARGDVTTLLFVPKKARVTGRVVIKAPGVLCGVSAAVEVFKQVEPSCKVRVLAEDGRRVRPGQAVLEVSGGRGILTAERTALNILQHLSGVATVTAEYAAKVKGTRAKVFDTRKTLPGLRLLDKYAVLCGGGRNHRLGLHDAVLLKDNHWTCEKDLPKAAAKTRRRFPGMVLEIEAADLSQVRLALEARPDIILLDNMGQGLLRKAIRLIRSCRPSPQVEISGGVSLSTIRSLAELGPDRISVGRITHSAPALDMSLELSS